MATHAPALRPFCPHLRLPRTLDVLARQVRHALEVLALRLGRPDFRRKGGLEVLQSNSEGRNTEPWGKALNGRS